METKICLTCVQKKSINDFHQNKTKIDGHQSQCKSCVNKHQKQYRRTQEYKDKQKRYQQTDKGRAMAKASLKRFRQTEKGKIATRKKVLKRYGLIPDDYNQMFTNQNGCCAICKTHQSKFKRALVVDHNRETGAIRELLCDHCNLMLGMAKHSVDRLRAGIIYMEKHDAE